MLKLLHRSKNSQDSQKDKQNKPNKPSESIINNKNNKNNNKSDWFSRLKLGLTKTREQFTENLATIFLGKKEIDAALLPQLEQTLILADIGIDTTNHLIETLRHQLSRQALKDSQSVVEALKTEMKTLLKPAQSAINWSSDTHKNPLVILIVGVNGSGKTTTIAKLANYFQKENKKVMLAAGDTFRAAAIEQLKIWGERHKIPVIAQQSGSDSSSVLFDALQAAQSRKVDCLIMDTAGRLHTQLPLMDELKKNVRVIQKLDITAPHYTLLTIDATNGQNSLNQAKQFHEAVNINGICLTKLDGTAKGGIIFSIVNTLNLPIYFIGFGEQSTDLRPFNSDDFVDALFSDFKL